MSSYVQVDRSSVEAAVPEQHLDGLQIGSGLQQMSGKTVTQHMGTDPFGQSSPASCLLTDSLHRAFGESRAVLFSGKQPTGRLISLPVHPKLPQQCLRERSVAVFAAFSATDSKYHPLTVDVRDGQVQGLGKSQPSGVNRHQQGPVFEVVQGSQQAGHLVGAQDHRKFLFLLGKGDVLDGPVFVQADPVEEAQSANRLVEDRPGSLLGFHQKDLILANLLGSQQMRGLAEMARELSHPSDIGFDGALCIVADPQILD